jgi:hypothetical protein
MADIVNGGIIVLVAGFCLVAVVGAIDQLRPDAEPTGSLAGADGDSGPVGPEPSEAREARPPALGRFADDRGDDRHRDKDDEDKEREKEKDDEDKERQKEKDEEDEEQENEKEEDDEDDGD